MTSTNVRGREHLMRIVKGLVFHIQPLIKDWVKLYNPQASYFTDYYKHSDSHGAMLD
jgi:hypothetical protein